MTTFEIFSLVLFFILVIPLELTKWGAVVYCVKLSKEYDECD